MSCMAVDCRYPGRGLILDLRLTTVINPGSGAGVFQANWIDKHQSGPGKAMAIT